LKIVTRKGVKIYLVAPRPGKFRFENAEMTRSGSQFVARWRYAAQPDDIFLHVTFLKFGLEGKALVDEQANAARNRPSIARFYRN
jgi:hypothetical protein